MSVKRNLSVAFVADLAQETDRQNLPGDHEENCLVRGRGNGAGPVCRRCDPRDARGAVAVTPSLRDQPVHLRGPVGGALSHVLP